MAGSLRGPRPPDSDASVALRDAGAHGVLVRVPPTPGPAGFADHGTEGLQTFRPCTVSCPSVDGFDLRDGCVDPEPGVRAAPLYPRSVKGATY